MIVSKSCLNILIGILIYTCRVNGQLAINLPAFGNYMQATEMNCTDSTFDIANGYTWYKDNIKIYDNTIGDAGKYKSTHGIGYFTLVIDNTALNDNGSYRCNYNFQDATDTLEIQAKDSVTSFGKLQDGILEITITGLYPGATTISYVVGNGMTFPGTQTIKPVADLFEIEWTSSSAASIDSEHVKDGCDVTIISLTTFVIHVKIESPIPTTPIPPGPGCWCRCWWRCCDDWRCLFICWIVSILLIALILYLVGIIIGLILTKTSCCCRGFYHCQDSDCCECCWCCGQNKYVTCACCASLPCRVCCNIAGLPFWVQVLWGTIVGAPVALGIYTVLKCCGRGNGNVEAKRENSKPETQSGNPRTGQKKPDTKIKSIVSAQTENEKHNQGRKPREQPPKPLVARTTETPMSGREDSDSAVSREHVNLQDSDRALSVRPMPAIPSAGDRQGHDSKGRGLSANFNDDDHPLIGVDIPLKKAGDLGALPEGTGGEEPVKKKKKRKKKSQEDEV